MLSFGRFVLAIGSVFVAFTAFQDIATAQGNLTNGGNHSGAISLPGEIDTWTFQAAKDDAISVKIGEVVLSEVDPGFVPYIRLRGPDAAQLGSAFGSLAAGINIKAPLTGIYTVLVASNDARGSARGSYLLTLAKTPGDFIVPPGDQGGAMANGGNHAGTIYVGDLDMWTFQAAKGDAISVKIGEVVTSEKDPGFVPYIRLRGPDGTQLGADFGSLAAGINATAPLTGTYTVLVSTNDAYGDATGSYSLTLAKTPGDFIVPSGDEGGPMTNGGNHAGFIRVGDLDMWTFQAAKGDAISVKIGEVLTSEKDPGFVPWIRLRGPDGAQLGSDFGSLAAGINATAPLTGTYTVLVSTNDAYGDATGNYLLTLARTPGAFIVPPGDEGGQLTNLRNHSGSIYVGDLDQWSFFAAKDDAISVTISEPPPGEKDPGFVPWIRLRGPDGTQLGSNWGAVSAQINLRAAPLTGTYTVLVSTNDAYGDATGSYVISTANTGLGQLRYTVTDGGGQSMTSPASSGAVTAGYVRIDPDGGNLNPSGLAIFGFRQNNILVSEAAVPASGLISSGRIYAEIAGAVDTGLAIVNPNNLPVTIGFYFTDTNGQNFGTGSTVLPGNTQLARFLSQAPFSSGASVIGTFTFTASLPVSVIALRGLTNERSEFIITTLPVSDLSAAPTKDPVLFPHFADGGGWTTQIVMVNPTEDVMTGSIQFYSQGSSGEAGQLIDVTIAGQTANSISYSIPARSSRTLRTSGLGSAIQVGSARITPSGASATPSGLGVFNFRNVSEAGVRAVPAGTAFRMYVESSGNFNAGEIGSIQTGLAIANSSAVATTVKVDLYNLVGTPTGLTSVLTVPANGQVALFLGQIPGFAALPGSFKGVLRLSSPAGVSIVGLRGRYNERNDFLITTTQPVNEAAAPSSSLFFFPHIADGGGYTTQFILFSGTPGQSSGTIRLLSQSALALNWVLQ
ncbi:MAG TPA: hypothetical protein VE422_44160 [Terriglobia bacterium]|nr:hypothetical protein [Terriglobia bacterium]